MYAFNFFIPNIAKFCELSSDKLHNFVIKIINTLKSSINMILLLVNSIPFTSNSKTLDETN